MRLFQIASMYEAYLKYFEIRYPQSYQCDFKKRLELLTADRYGAAHLLKPALEGHPDAFLVWGNDKKLQFAWAAEHGMRTKNLEKILLAQIEAHQTEVLYVLPSSVYDSSFIKKLPGCVKKTLGWRAAPLGKADLSEYDLCLTNFSKFIAKWSEQGINAAWFWPSHDPVMADYADNKNRPVDIIFAGSYTRLHKRRSAILHAVAGLADKYKVEMYINHNPFRSVNIFGLFRLPLFINHIPRHIRSVAMPPVFGLDLYSSFSRAKIVVNIHIDMALNYRGNMRCFEALGCGACLVSDAGVYINGLSPGGDFIAYRDVQDCVKVIDRLLYDPHERRKVARTGAASLIANFSKDAQWDLFRKLIGRL